MKITATNEHRVATVLPQGQRTPKEAGVAEPRHGGDAVEVSPEARLLARIRARLEAEAARPSERVEELKAQVRSGRYQVDLEKLAERLLNYLR